MTDIQQARKWAKEVSEEYFTYITDDSRAAIKVIQSLPDQVIDAEKVREIYDRYRASEITLHEAFLAAVALTAPPLPTLAELIEQGDDPQQYQWMQCNVEGRGDDTFVIAVVGERVNKVLLPDGLHEVKGNNQVTPLPDLPRLEWPAQAPRNPETPPAETLNNPSSDTPRNPRPEDVPAGEPWIVQHEDREWIGCRNEPESSLPWLLIRRDEHQFDYCYDTDITLVSRMVPEVKP